MATRDAPPSALLLMAPGCAHCPVVLEGLVQLIEKGKLGRLEVVNILAHPERAQEVGTRSVPWTRIGPFELSGALTAGELAQWVTRAAEGTGIGAYYGHLLEDRKLDRVVAMIRETPATLNDLLSLLEDKDTPMAVRIGVGAVMEELQASGLISEALPELMHLAESDDPALRADACHYLGLSGDSAARPALEARLQDEDAEVREIAAESLVLLDTEPGEPTQ